LRPAAPRPAVQATGRYSLRSAEPHQMQMLILFLDAPYQFRFEHAVSPLTERVAGASNSRQGAKPNPEALLFVCPPRSLLMRYFGSGGDLARFRSKCGRGRWRCRWRCGPSRGRCRCRGGSRRCGGRRRGRGRGRRMGGQDHRFDYRLHPLFGQNQRARRTAAQRSPQNIPTISCHC
jgi:hypothetical protein